MNGGAVSATLANRKQGDDKMNMSSDSPRAKVADIIAYWRRKVTDADMDAVRTMVNDAIDKSGLDATATVEEDDSYADMVDMGHKPIKATIKINNAFPSVRMVNGTLVKGADTITVIFQREAGVYDHAKHHELMQVRHENADKMSAEEALAAGDALPWEGESVEFSARTNGKARDYRKRHWYPYEGVSPAMGLTILADIMGMLIHGQTLPPISPPISGQ